VGHGCVDELIRNDLALGCGCESGEQMWMLTTCVVDYDYHSDLGHCCYCLDAAQHDEGAVVDIPYRKGRGKVRSRARLLELDVVGVRTASGQSK
jgi:hypothetical protein